jgi:TonB family protein
MEMVRSMAARRASLADAPAMAETSDLESRVRALLDGGRNRAPLTRRVAMTVAAVACVLALPVATLTTHAQTGRGALAGIVQDPSGARVPKASITAKSLDGSNQETTAANEAGEYLFASIPSGRYTVEARVPGFKLVQAQVFVVSGASARADVLLEIGGISESVTVRKSRTAPAATPQPLASRERIPIGGNVKMARLITQPKPVYPDDLRLAGVTGTVRIRSIISKTGEVLNPVVLNTDVHPGLARAALEAIKQWRYEPTLLNGQPVEVVTTADITYELDQ